MKSRDNFLARIVEALFPPIGDDIDWWMTLFRVFCALALIAVVIAAALSPPTPPPLSH
jgi:hypothetical protein